MITPKEAEAIEKYREALIQLHRAQRGLKLAREFALAIRSKEFSELCAEALAAGIEFCTSGKGPKYYTKWSPNEHGYSLEVHEGKPVHPEWGERFRKTYDRPAELLEAICDWRVAPGGDPRRVHRSVPCCATPAAGDRLPKGIDRSGSCACHRG